jgi:hypothetical protein
VAVFQALGGGGAGIVERENLCGDEFRIEAKGDEIGAERGDDEPDGVERLVAFEGDGCEGAGAGECDGRPQNYLEDGFHISPLAPGDRFCRMGRIVRKREGGVNRELDWTGPGGA